MEFRSETLMEEILSAIIEVRNIECRDESKQMLFFWFVVLSKCWPEVKTNGFVAGICFRSSKFLLETLIEEFDLWELRKMIMKMERNQNLNHFLENSKIRIPNSQCEYDSQQFSNRFIRNQNRVSVGDFHGYSQIRFPGSTDWKKDNNQY